MKDPLDATISWRHAADLAHRLAAEEGAAISVKVLPSEWALDRWGACRNTVVYFHRSGVPAHVVAHEVAHALGPSTEEEHGPEWKARFKALTARLQQFL